MVAHCLQRFWLADGRSSHQPLERKLTRNEMRKRTITPAQPETTSPDDEWLDLETLADVEITSEDAAHPIEWRCCRGALPADGAPQLPESKRFGCCSLVRNAEADLAQLRGAGQGAHAGIRPALVGGWRTVVSRHRAATVELQPARRNARDGRSSRRSTGSHRARVEHRSGHEQRECRRFVGANSVSARATLPLRDASRSR